MPRCTTESEDEFIKGARKGIDFSAELASALERVGELADSREDQIEELKAALGERDNTIWKLESRERGRHS